MMPFGIVPMAGGAGESGLEPLPALVLGVVLLALNAFFVGAEFALVSARRTQIEPLAASGRAGARTTLRALENVSLMMAGAQLGITLCTLLLGAIAEPAVVVLIEPLLHLIGVPEALTHPIAFVVALSIVVLLHVVLGEMVPKNLSLAAPERAALLLGPPLSWMLVVLRPVIWLLNKFANLNLRLLGVEPRDEVSSTFTADEVKGMVDESHGEGMIERESYELLSGALAFGDRTIESIVIPLEKVRLITTESTPVDLEELCAETGYSRFPVLDRGSDDELVGYVHIKDALETSPTRRESPVAAKWVRPMATLSSSSRLADTIQVMQARRAHMARVLDGEHRVIGVVALEDVLEELVGTVRDVVRADSD